MRTKVAIALGLALLWTGVAHAYESLFAQLETQKGLSGIFPPGNARARVEDGPLLGFGQEHTVRLPDGRLRVEQVRRYSKIRNPETGAVAKLPEGWTMRTRLLISPELRMLQSDIKLDFHRSADRAFEDYKISEEREDLFEFDHIRTVANASVTQLTRTAWLKGKQIEVDTFDYPANAIPVEISGFSLAAAVSRKVEHFDFDLLLPDGSTHGINAVVHHTRDLSPYAKGYPLPGHQLHRPEDVAIVEMRLSSSIKYLLFPYRFFMVYPVSQPGRLLALWGGEPGDHVAAFRVD